MKSQLIHRGHVLCTNISPHQVARDSTEFLAKLSRNVATGRGWG